MILQSKQTHIKHIPMQYVAKGMVERGEGGAIVNVSSLSSLCALKEHAVYCEYALIGTVEHLWKIPSRPTLCSEVSLAQGLVVDHAPLSIVAI